jgi:hypothetical protein
VQSTPYTGKDRGGRRTVTYRDAAGRTTLATVMDAGAEEGELTLYDPTRGRTIEDVPKATEPKQTNVWFGNH